MRRGFFTAVIEPLYRELRRRLSELDEEAPDMLKETGLEGRGRDMAFMRMEKAGHKQVVESEGPWGVKQLFAALLFGLLLTLFVPACLFWRAL